MADDLAAASTATGPNLDAFFASIESLKSTLHDLDRLHRRLADANDAIQTAAPATIHDLRSSMDADLAAALNTSKLIKLRLDSLDRDNAANRSIPLCGPGSPTDRTRTAVVAALRRSLKTSMETFSDLRSSAAAERREAVGRLYYAVTGERAEEEKVEYLVETGEGERLVRRAMEEGREAAAVVEERRGAAAAELERSLVELQEVFVEMRVLVEVQGEELDDIEGNVGKAASFVREGVEELEGWRGEQRERRRMWAWIVGLLVVLVVVLLVVGIVIKSVNGRKIVVFLLDF